MMYGPEAVVGRRATRSTAESDSDDEPHTLQHHDDDDDDDDSSDDDDNVDDAEGDQKMVKTRELEWDDSTLSY